MPINPGRILHQDEWLLCVHKLPGELTVAGKGKIVKLSLFDFLRKEFPGIHPLNRLDHETSGIVVFARTKKVLADVVDGGFQGWVKTYQALVAGRPIKEGGDIALPLPTRVTGEHVKARTRYRVMERFAFCSLIEAEIEAGKHHQIRRHMAMIGHPLALDGTYGDKKFNGIFSQKYGYHRFFLHASSVRFPHPVTGAEVVVEDPLPLSFSSLLKRLRVEMKKESAKKGR